MQTNAVTEMKKAHERHHRTFDLYDVQTARQAEGKDCELCASDWGHYRICPLIGGEGLRDTTTLIDLGIDFKDELALERRREPRFDPHRHTHKHEREVTA